jgi:hypothetical protein
MGSIVACEIGASVWGIRLRRIPVLWLAGLVAFIPTGCSMPAKAPAAPAQETTAAASSPGFVRQSSYGGDCGQRPAGTTCLKFSDGYVWLVRDGIGGWRNGPPYQGRSVEIALGAVHSYEHVLGTDLVAEEAPTK